MESQEPTPQQQLRDLARTRDALRARAVAPWWYYGGIGVAATSFVLLMMAQNEWSWLRYVVLGASVLAIAHVSGRIQGLRHRPATRTWVVMACGMVAGVVAIAGSELAEAWDLPLLIVPFALLSGAFLALMAWRGDRADAARLQDERP